MSEHPDPEDLWLWPKPQHDAYLNELLDGLIESNKRVLAAWGWTTATVGDAFEQIGQAGERLHTPEPPDDTLTSPEGFLFPPLNVR